MKFYTITIFTFLLTTTTCNNNELILTEILGNNNNPNSLKMLINLLIKFNEIPHSFNIFHYNNNTNKYLVNILTITSPSTLNKAIQLYNYDLIKNSTYLHNIQGQFKPINKFDCKTIIHIVLISNELFVRYNDEHLFCTIIIFYNPEPTVRSEFSELTSPLVIYWIDEKVLEEFKLWSNQVWLQKNISDINFFDAEDIFEYKFRNFYGHLFRVSYTNLHPFLMCFEYPPYCNHGLSVEGQMIEIASKVLNFSYELELMRYVPNKAKNKTIGTKQKSLLLVVNKSLDFSIGGISITYPRQKILRFTIPYTHQSSIFYFGTLPNSPSSIFAILHQFRSTLWVALFSQIFFTAFVLRLILKLFQVLTLPYYRITNFLMAFLVEQSPPKYRVFNGLKTLTSIRIISFCWAIFSIILTSIYKSRLSASMFLYPNPDPNYIQDFLNLNYRFHFNLKDSTALQSYLAWSDHEKYQQVLANGFSEFDVCESIRYALDNPKIAVLGEKVFSKFYISTHCNNSFTREDYARLRIAIEHVFPTGYGWAFHKHAPYVFVFDKLLEIFREGGFYSKWFRDAMRVVKHIDLSTKPRAVVEQTPLQFRDLWSPFFFLGFGLFLAFLAFVCETWVLGYFRRKFKNSFRRTVTKTNPKALRRVR